MWYVSVTPVDGEKGLTEINLGIYKKRGQERRFLCT